MKDNQDQFDFSGGDKKPHEMVCPQCLGKGKIPYTPKPSIIVRPGDPVTSHKAAEKHATDDLGKFTRRNVKAKLLKLFGEEGAEFTREEAAELVAPYQIDNVKFQTARKRVSDLVTVKYLEIVFDENGKVLERPNRNSTSKSDSEVLRISALGRAALKSLLETGHTR